MTHLTDDTIRALMEAATPGPWFVAGCRVKIERQETHAICRYDAVHKKDINIANVWYDPRFNVGLCDARLIAAAPDLATECLSRGAALSESHGYANDLESKLVVAEAERDAALAWVKAVAEWKHAREPYKGAMATDQSQSARNARLDRLGSAEALVEKIFAAFTARMEGGA